MMIPVMSIVGRLGIGWVSDFVNRRAIMILMVLGQLIGIILFLYAHQILLLIPSVILFGVSYGGIMVLRLGVLRDYYGSTHIGSIIGLCLGLTSIGLVCGPLLAGWIVDTTGSYNLAWIVASILVVIGIPLMLVMKNSSARKRGN